ncbi:MULTISPECIES: rhodanese-like domain-containing protein [unclassified Mesorhizobium]|uniref:rhodanese-like domain-containing protein n=1 Tax=unclassified Mesorhizobium TaxID=325217 RepID=UPI001FF075E9|nr:MULTISPECIES: rhodanese-like domain-containing protein [unclassified Mesorhizobium]
MIEADKLSLLAAFRLLDVRDAEAFQADHAASAVRVPVEPWEAAAKTGEASFENTSCRERAIADPGVAESVPAVVYDDGRMTEAARVGP